MAVCRVDRAAGEDVRAADEVRVQVATDHEHFEPVSAVSQDQDRGRVAQDDIGHPCSSGAVRTVLFGRVIPVDIEPLDILHVARPEGTHEAGARVHRPR